MSDEAIGREIRQFREDVRDDLAGLRADIGRLVSRDVHDAELGRITDRVSTVERDLDRLVTAIETDRRTTAERRAADRRVVIGCLLAAVLSVAVSLLRGTGALP